jgi:hypothetical protein
MCGKIDGTGDHHVRQSKPGIERQVWCASSEEGLLEKGMWGEDRRESSKA